MLATHASDQSTIWNLPSSETRQCFALSLDGSVSFELPDILKRSLSAESIGEQDIDDVYYDTKTLVLYRQGYACCIRQMQGQSVLCLLPVTVSGGADARRASFTMNLSSQKVAKKLRVGALESGEIKSLLRSLIEGKKLFKQFRVRTHRRYFEFTDSSHRYPLILDRVTITSNNVNQASGKSAVQYDELILPNGEAESRLPAMIQSKLKSQISLQSSKTGAFSRALEMDSARIINLRNIDVSSKLSERSGHDLFRAHMRTQLAVLTRWESVAIEGAEKEGVHQMRVSIRRIRAVLKTFAPLLSKPEVTHWHCEFRWLAKRLGGVRDLDVFTEWLQQKKVSVDAGEKNHLDNYGNDIGELYSHARQGLLSSLASDRYRLLLREFSVWIEQEQCFFVNSDLMWMPTQELSDELIQREIRRVYRGFRKLSRHSLAEDLHKFRVECKRARYSLDMLEGTASRSYSRLGAQLKHIQEVLGDHQDACDRSKRIRLYANGQSAGKHGQDFVFYLGGIFAARQPEIKSKARKFFKTRSSALQAMKNALN